MEYSSEETDSDSPLYHKKRPTGDCLCRDSIVNRSKKSKEFASDFNQNVVQRLEKKMDREVEANRIRVKKMKISDSISKSLAQIHLGKSSEEEYNVCCDPSVSQTEEPRNESVDHPNNNLISTSTPNNDNSFMPEVSTVSLD